MLRASLKLGQVFKQPVTSSHLFCALKNKEALNKSSWLLYGAANLPKLELFKIVYVLKDLLNQEFVSKLKSQIELTKSINVNFS